MLRLSAPSSKRPHLVSANHSLSQSGQAIYSLRPSTLAKWQYASKQQNSLLITKKEAIKQWIFLPFRCFKQVQKSDTKIVETLGKYFSK